MSTDPIERTLSHNHNPGWWRLALTAAAIFALAFIIVYFVGGS
jgi:hypothetical protein